MIVNLTTTPESMASRSLARRLLTASLARTEDGLLR